LISEKPILGSAPLPSMSLSHEFTEYPDCDHPYSFYVMNLGLPRYSNCWHYIPNETFESSIFTKIDHVGVIESAPSSDFIIAAQHMLACALQCQPCDLRCRDADKVRIRESIIEGLFDCIEISQSHSTIFWTSGYQNDFESLKQYIYRSGLDNKDPLYLEPPHVRRFKRDQLIDYTQGLRVLHRLGSEKHIPKHTKRRLQSLKHVIPPDIILSGGFQSYL